MLLLPTGPGGGPRGASPAPVDDQPSNTRTLPTGTATGLSTGLGGLSTGQGLATGLGGLSTGQGLSTGLGFSTSHGLSTGQGVQLGTGLGTGQGLSTGLGSLGTGLNSLGAGYLDEQSMGAAGGGAGRRGANYWSTEEKTAFLEVYQVNGGPSGCNIVVEQ